MLWHLASNHTCINELVHDFFQNSLQFQLLLALAMCNQTLTQEHRLNVILLKGHNHCLIGWNTGGIPCKGASIFIF